MPSSASSEYIIQMGPAERENVRGGRESSTAVKVAR